MVTLSLLIMVLPLPHLPMASPQICARARRRRRHPDLAQGQGVCAAGLLLRTPGRPRGLEWHFDIARLYSQAARVDGLAMEARFDWAKIKQAVDALDRSSTPGLDQLGPSFNQAA